MHGELYRNKYFLITERQPTMIMQRNITALIVSLVLIYLAGFWIDVMDIDAAQYASISREMSDTGNYLHVFDKGKDYLDKPPFLFWISALSMKIFGANNF